MTHTFYQQTNSHSTLTHTRIRTGTRSDMVIGVRVCECVSRAASDVGRRALWWRSLRSSGSVAKRACSGMWCRDDRYWFCELKTGGRIRLKTIDRRSTWNGEWTLWCNNLLRFMVKICSFRRLMAFRFPNYGFQKCIGISCILHYAVNPSICWHFSKQNIRPTNLDSRDGIRFFSPRDVK